MQGTVRETYRKNPGCLIQLLWFGFIGWWACQLWVAIAWLLMVIIITIPLSITMINNLPKVVALREPKKELVITYRGNDSTVSVRDLPQVNLLIRILYFLLVGWWLSAIWMEVGYFFCLTIIGLPLGFWMFDKTPAVLTLRRQ